MLSQDAASAPRGGRRMWKRYRDTSSNFRAFSSMCLGPSKPRAASIMTPCLLTKMLVGKLVTPNSEATSPPSSRMRYVSFSCLAKSASVSFGSSHALIARTTRPSSPCFLAIRLRCGASARQGGQPYAQKESMTGLPRKSASRTFCPSSEVNSKSGAGLSCIWETNRRSLIPEQPVEIVRAVNMRILTTRIRQSLRIEGQEIKPHSDHSTGFEIRSDYSAALADSAAAAAAASSSRAFFLFCFLA